MQRHIQEQMAARRRADEAIIRELLGRWVSELEPSVAYDRDGNVIGLCAASAEIGTRPFVLVREP